MGYGYFQAAVDMEGKYREYQLTLEIEYGRLLDWGEAVGIRDSGAGKEEFNEVFEKRMKVDGTIVMAVLSEMRLLLKEMRRVSLRYEKIESGELPKDPATRTKLPVENVNLEKYYEIFQSPNIPQDKRQYPRGFNHLIQMAKGIKKVAVQPKRIWWAMHDRDVFKEKLDRMSYLTRYLRQSLGDRQMDILLGYTRDNYLAVLQLSISVEEIKALLKAGRADTETASIFSQAETLVEERPVERGASQPGLITHLTMFDRLVAFRLENFEVDTAKEFERSRVPLLQMLEDNETSGQHKELGGERVIVEHEGRPAWIEWKRYDSKHDPSSNKWRAPQKAVKNAERLVALLRSKNKPAEFCVPDCAGYYDDEENERFGFMYEAPGGKQDAIELISLLDLFKLSPPPLKARITLAQQLSTCMLYLHATNWLHKALMSRSVIFMSKEDSRELLRPSISGFEYSRPDEDEETSGGAPNTPEWAVYCHPDYNGRPGLFRKSYDIYSLGIILLEIAHWQPATTIFGFQAMTDKNSKEVSRIPYAI